jgi:hypothetical protein
MGVRAKVQTGESIGPTPQRILRAAEAGLGIEEWGSGEERHWRISPVLQELKRRKTISSDSHAAFCRFLREYYLGLYASPKAFGYREKTSPGANGSADYLTQRIHYARETERAILAVPPIFKLALEWVVSTLGESAPLSTLGQHYAPNLGAQTQSAKAGMVLELMGAELCQHYGISHHLIDTRGRISTLAQLLLEHEQA